MFIQKIRHEYSEIKILEYSHPVNPSAMEVAGVFWDIENCAVPHHKSAFALVQVQFYCTQMPPRNVLHSHVPNNVWRTFLSGI